MITVVVYVNGSPILARSARNTGRTDDLGRHVYDVDDGRTLLHRRDDKCVPLVVEMLNGIKEPVP